MTKEHVEKAIAPFAASLRECIDYGYEKWMEFGERAGDLRAPLDGRARACFINRHIVAKVSAVFADNNAVRVVDVRGFVELVLLKSRLILRFKKLDKNGLSRNILTSAQRLWFEEHAKLPHMPERAVKLIAGYVLDDITANLSRVLVTMPNGPSSVMFKIELPETGGATLLEIPRTPQNPKAPNVRSRKRKTDESDKDE
jgi:hypothetical protein